MTERGRERFVEVREFEFEHALGLRREVNVFAGQMFLVVAFWERERERPLFPFFHTHKFVRESRDVAVLREVDAVVASGPAFERHLVLLHVEVDHDQIFLRRWFGGTDLFAPHGLQVSERLQDVSVCYRTSSEVHERRAVVCKLRDLGGDGRDHRELDVSAWREFVHADLRGTDRI